MKLSWLSINDFFVAVSFEIYRKEVTKNMNRTKKLHRSGDLEFQQF